jgi:nucleotide-binding universal stress UspA family protein
MFERIIVPTSGSDAAWRGVVAGDRLAAQCGGQLEVVHVYRSADDGDILRDVAQHRFEEERFRSESPIALTLPWEQSAAHTIAGYVRSLPGAQIVMSSEGHGRTGPILGEIEVELLNEDVGPVIVVGPNATTARANMRGELIVAVDADAGVDPPLRAGLVDFVARWSIELGQKPWFVTVPVANDPRWHRATNEDLARDLADRTGRTAEAEVLEGNHPARSVADFAQSIDAALIVVVTHARTGFDRLAHGSEAAAIVRHAPCPVVLVTANALARDADADRLRTTL